MWIRLGPFVFGFLQEGEDGTMVSLQGAERVEVAESSREKTRHASEAFEHDEAPLDGRSWGVHLAVARDEVECLVQGVHRYVGNFITCGDGHELHVLGGELLLEFFFGPYVIHLAPT